jgi:tetratricopeptide (TPR) repeat protein
LVGAELIYRRGTPPDAEYTFKHALVQDAAYSTLLRGPRQQLHARIAGTLENRFQEIVAAQPALLAHHCTEAGLTEQAVGYLLKAGRQAVARAVMTEAVAQLQRGLELLGTLPDSPWRKERELDLQVALGPALFATRGFGAPDVGRTLARGLALVEQLDRPDYLAPLLYGQWVFHNARADYKLALSFAKRLEQIGKARNDDAARLLGHFVQGLTRLQLGEITAARALCEESHGLSNLGHRAIYAAVTAEDPHVVMIGALATALAALGYVDQARAKIDEALAEGRRLDNASTLALTFLHACQVARSVASPREVLRYAEEMVALSRVQNLRLYLALGSVYCGWSLTILGQTREGQAMLTKGLSDVRATGAVNVSGVLVMLGETHAKLGRTDESLNCLTEAETIIEMTGGRFIESNLHRLRGELLNATGNEAAAEQSYSQALAVARRQEAKLSELRAAMSLARLRHEQGKRAAARDLLGPVYDWFTEGLDTPVLKEARALLEELAS